MNAVTHFDFKSSSVRIVLDNNGEPLFCLADVCKVLNISRSSDLLQIQRGYVKNETPKRPGALDPIGVHKISVSTNGGKQELIFINEPNLYRVIFRSNKPEALNFQNWVFAEVLPTLRKTGSYSARQTAFDELNRLCMQAKTQKAKGSFHGTGLVNHRYSMRDLNLRIATCTTNLQLTFEGLHHD
jgi:prophage antirepressor-like protein